ncbi:UNVERIFIED_CONTAM: Transcription factor R1 [Sesamum calycinum]|uniref:Transcription factor R1 n=1 Tax=Sesamum calycinum TaxID=2727403 RepID=A0AAW2NJM5_9LAMI
MSQSSEATSAAVGGGGGVGEIMLFGVRVKVDPMRKSVSMNNLSEYEPVNTTSNPKICGSEVPKAVEEDGGAAGYASADDAVPQPSNGNRERVPWTEEEHKLFLIGLQKVGRGDWRGISRNYVKTRTPTQVASHAQKYFLRRSNLNRRRRRSSLFDITTDSVAAMPVEEGKNHQESAAQPVATPTALPLPITSNVNGFSVVPFPVNVGPVLFSVQNGNTMENSTLGQSDLPNNSSFNLVRPRCSYACFLKMVDLNLKQQAPIEPSPLSLRLSLSSGQDQPSTRDSAFQMLPSFKTVIAS